MTTPQAELATWMEDLRSRGYRLLERGPELHILPPKPRLPRVLFVLLALILPFLAMFLRDLSAGRELRIYFTGSLFLGAVVMLAGVALSADKIVLGQQLSLVRRVFGIRTRMSWNRCDIISFVVRPLSVGTPSILSVRDVDGKTEPLISSASVDVPDPLLQLLDQWRQGAAIPAALRR